MLKWLMRRMVYQLASVLFAIVIGIIIMFGGGLNLDAIKNFAAEQTGINGDTAKAYVARGVRTSQAGAEKLGLGNAFDDLVTYTSSATGLDLGKEKGASRNPCDTPSAPKTILVSHLYSGYVDAKVDRVKDGDTVVVIHNGEKMNIRLLEVDTFEVFASKSMDADVIQFHLKKGTLKNLGQFGSSITKQLLHKGQHVRLTFKNNGSVSKGYYGRVLAFIHLDDNSVLNEILVRSGGALVYRGDKTRVHNRYLKLESLARDDDLGIWQNQNVRKYYH